MLVKQYLNKLDDEEIAKRLESMEKIYYSNDMEEYIVYDKKFKTYCKYYNNQLVEINTVIKPSKHFFIKYTEITIGKKFRDGKDNMIEVIDYDSETRLFKCYNNGYKIVEFIDEEGKIKGSEYNNNFVKYESDYIIKNFSLVMEWEDNMNVLNKDISL